MSKIDKKTDESEFKERYKEAIRRYLPQIWTKDRVDVFVEELFKGLLYDPKSEFGQAIDCILYRLHKKWLFVPLPVYDDGHRRTGVKYFPNPLIKPEKKETAREQYQKL